MKTQLRLLILPITMVFLASVLLPACVWITDGQEDTSESEPCPSDCEEASSTYIQSTMVTQSFDDMVTPTLLSSETVSPSELPARTELPCNEADGTNLIPYFPDQDGDGYGVLTQVEYGCTPPEGFVDNFEDCDDFYFTINPSVDEICGNSIDENCDEWAATCYNYEPVDWYEAHPVGMLQDFDSALDLLTCSLDLNHDGLDDLVLSRTYYLVNLEYFTDVRVFFAPFTAQMDLDTPDHIFTTSHEQNFGQAIYCDSDFSGDGLADLLIAAPAKYGGWYEYDFGAVYGFITPFVPVNGSVSYADDADLIIMETERESQFGWDLAGNGDVNGDGVDDLLVTAKSAGVNDSGEAFLFLGPLVGLHSADDADANLKGAAPTDFGFYSLIDGDYNSDGHSDVVISQPKYGDSLDCLIGKVSVFYGPLTGSIRASESDVEIVSNITFDRLGYSMVNVSHYGKDWLALGAPSLRDFCSVVSNDVGKERGAVHIFAANVPGYYDIEDSSWSINGENDEDHFGAVLLSVTPNTSTEGLFISSSSHTLAEGGEVGAAYLLDLFAPSVVDARFKFRGNTECETISMASLRHQNVIDMKTELFQFCTHSGYEPDGNSAYLGLWHQL